MIAEHRRRPLTRVGAALALAVSAGLAPADRPAPQSRPPNVVLIITEDQGYGDLGAHGNPKLQTPNLDRLAGAAVHFRSFYVSPVCSPTRSSVMTGRYNYRTGVVDTYLGRSLMHPDETTIGIVVAGGTPHGHFRQIASGR